MKDTIKGSIESVGGVDIWVIFDTVVDVTGHLFEKQLIPFHEFITPTLGSHKAIRGGEKLGLFFKVPLIGEAAFFLILILDPPE